VSFKQQANSEGWRKQRAGERLEVILDWWRVLSNSQRKRRTISRAFCFTPSTSTKRFTGERGREGIKFIEGRKVEIVMKNRESQKGGKVVTQAIVPGGAHYSLTVEPMVAPWQWVAQ
jgi:hypothetical protein